MGKTAKERLEEADKIIDENYNLEAEKEESKEVPETSLEEQPEEEKTPGVEVIKFNPITYKNKDKQTVTISEIVLDSSKITGRVMAQAEKQYIYNGYTSVNNFLHQSIYFQQIVASKISGVDLEFILDELPASKVLELGLTIQGFLQA